MTIFQVQGKIEHTGLFGMVTSLLDKEMVITCALTQTYLLFYFEKLTS